MGLKAMWGEFADAADGSVAAGAEGLHEATVSFDIDKRCAAAIAQPRAHAQRTFTTLRNNP